MYNNFFYYTPTKVAFGKGVEAQTGKLAKEFGGSRVLLVYGGGSVIRSGLLERVEKYLEEEGIAWVALGGVVPNPRMGKVLEGIEIGKREGVDMVISVGGGSAGDTAKAIAYGLGEPDLDVTELYKGLRQCKRALPVGVVLTLAATGTEMSSSSVITLEEGLIKRGYSSDLGRPKFAVMDPALTMTLPAYQTASGCADIWMHTMERWFEHDGSMEITDDLAAALLKNVMKHARILVEQPDNYESRAEIMWAGSLSHNGLTGCGGRGGDWATHKLEHELGGMYDVTHGAGLAAIWGTWARYVMKEDLHRFVKFAVDVFDVPAAEAGGSPREEETVALEGIEKAEQFFRDIHMPTSLTELGVDPTEEEYRELARKCAVTTKDNLGSARVLHEADMYAIFKGAK
ncbi:MAG: iron-containing alcohol dehydrogenase [Lachnospiraceae bacterium]|nr:iron-containing alcohol dehydrogenase [Lachnospiraceae bacterium]